MSSQDETDFLSAISDLAPVKLVRATYQVELKMEVNCLDVAGIDPIEGDLCLLNATLERRLKVHFYAAPSHYFVDKMESEIVEFHRCRRVKTWLAEGRLWFDDRANEGKKSADFVKWANSLLRWVRRNYHRDPGGEYVGPEAHELSNAGKLQLGAPMEPEIPLAERRRTLGLE